MTRSDGVFLTILQYLPESLKHINVRSAKIRPLFVYRPLFVFTGIREIGQKRKQLGLINKLSASTLLQNVTRTWRIQFTSNNCFQGTGWYILNWEKS